MGIRVARGSFDSPSSPNSAFDVTGVNDGSDFTGKILFLYCVLRTANGVAGAHMTAARGIALSSSERLAVSWVAQDAAPTMVVYAGNVTTQCLSVYDPADGSKDVECDFVSWSSGGFRLNFGTAVASYKVHWVVLGGDVEGKLIECAARTTNGTQNYTSSGFGVPTGAVIVHGCKSTTASVALARRTSNFAWGYCGSDLSQGYIATASEDTPTQSDTRRSQQLDKCFCMLSETTDSIVQEASITAFITDGIATDWNATDGTADIHHVLLLKNIACGCETAVPRTGTGTQDITGFGFNPLMAFHEQIQGTSLGVQTAGQCIFGAWFSSSSRFYFWLSDQDGVGTSVTDREMDDTHAFTVRGSTGTLVTQADFNGLIADGVQINWTTNDNATRRILVFAVGHDRRPLHLFEQAQQNPLPRLSEDRGGLLLRVEPAAAVPDGIDYFRQAQLNPPVRLPEDRGGVFLRVEPAPAVPDGLDYFRPAQQNPPVRLSEDRGALLAPPVPPALIDLFRHTELVLLRAVRDDRGSLLEPIIVPPDSAGLFHPAQLNPPVRLREDRSGLLERVEPAATPVGFDLFRAAQENPRSRLREERSGILQRLEPPPAVPNGLDYFRAAQQNPRRRLREDRGATFQQVIAAPPVVVPVFFDSHEFDPNLHERMFVVIVGESAAPAPGVVFPPPPQPTIGTGGGGGAVSHDQLLLFQYMEGFDPIVPIPGVFVPTLHPTPVAPDRLARRRLPIPESFFYAPTTEVGYDLVPFAALRRPLPPRQAPAFFDPFFPIVVDDDGQAVDCAELAEAGSGISYGGAAEGGVQISYPPAESGSPLPC